MPRPDVRLPSPTTTISASFDAQTSLGTRLAYCRSAWMSGVVPPAIVSIICLARLSISRACSSSPCVMVWFGAIAELTSVGATTLIRFIGTEHIMASRAAQRTAASDPGDPSTPTTMLDRMVGHNISSSRRA